MALTKCTALRSACMSIPDELAARMPLAYVHLTHCLVDVLLLIAPFGLYPHLGVLSVPMAGIISIFYRGLLELSKSFLDPFGNRRASPSEIEAQAPRACVPVCFLLMRRARARMACMHTQARLTLGPLRRHLHRHPHRRDQRRITHLAAGGAPPPLRRRAAAGRAG